MVLNNYIALQLNNLNKMKTCFWILALFFASLPALAQLEFVENKGQWDTKVLFKSDYSSGSFFLTNDGFTVLQHHPNDISRINAKIHGDHGGHDVESKNAVAQNEGLRSHAYKVSLLGAQAVQVMGEKAQADYNNYYLGNDATKWASHCKIFNAVVYKEVYPNIDARFYTENNQLKYDFIVHPGGNPNAIMLKYEGVDKLAVKGNELVIGTSVGENKELNPYTYQFTEGAKKNVSCKFKIEDDVVRFKVGSYNATQTLIIDPTLIFCTFSGSRATNFGYTATPGLDGSFYGGGIVFGAGFPTTTGPIFQAGPSGSYDMGIIKLSANGANRIYGTYIGGNENEQPHSMIADAAGNLYIAGRSNSSNFPVNFANPSQLGSRGDYDITLNKLSPSGALLNSIKMGGSGSDGVNIRDKQAQNPNNSANSVDATRLNYGDDARSEIILDPSGNVYVVSCSQSSDNSNALKFPTLNAVQSNFGGGRQDGVILKFNAALNNVLYSTYFGGEGDDACFVAALNTLTGNLYVAGGTTSQSLLGDKTGVYQPSFQGGAVDGFLTILNPAGTAIQKTTFLGTSGTDMVYGVQFDRKGFPYIMGTSTGNWPVQNAAFNNLGSRQFIAKLKQDISGFEYSTTFGTSNAVPNISPVAFLVDRCENVYVSGWGGSLNSRSGYASAGTLNMPAVDPLPGIPAPDGSDFYFIVIERNAQRQLFGSHFGKRAVASPPNDYGEHVDGGTSRFDQNGVIYQAVCGFGGGASFPTTSGSWSPRAGTLNFNLAMIKIEMNFAGVGATVQAQIGGLKDSVVCIGTPVNFIDTLAKGQTYVWNFGDGSPLVTTTAPNNSVSHTYRIVGNYTVTLVSIDPGTCNERDTATTRIRVGNNQVYPSFNIAKVGDCNSLEFQFLNTSTADDPSAFRPNTFTWDFGDGSAPVVAGLTTNVRHTFPAAGSYRIKLSIVDTLFCNTPKVLDTLIRISANVKASFTTPLSGCVPYNAEFQNTSLGGVSFIWEWGDNTTENNNNPTVKHLYSGIGTYRARLIAFDPNTCNKFDTSSYFTISVVDKPIANFSWGPQPAQANTATQFTNASIGATRYLWYFGDGATSELTNPSHQYNSTDSFLVELVAFNDAGCSDTAALLVPAIVNPLLDVPTAFSPGKFGINGIVKVLGFGIEVMDWRIYNRLGQLVFRSNDASIGWNGTFKGELQAMDTYTYTLQVTFSDGKKLTKTGDITLLR